MISIVYIVNCIGDSDSSLLPIKIGKLKGISLLKLETSEASISPRICTYRTIVFWAVDEPSSFTVTQLSQDQPDVK